MEVKFLDLQLINESYGKPLIDAAHETIQSGWYLRGRQTEAFEREWGDYCQAPYTVAVGNGLDALRLTLLAWKILLNWSDGDEVIVPANTFIATPLAVSQAGLRPVFCDVNLSDALICTETSYLESLLTPRTRCIIPVHLYGQLANLDRIYTFAAKYSLQVLEDACQAHGAQSIYNNVYKRTCAYSFYPGKNLGALGDGGCITTSDKELSTLIRSLANYGQSEKYIHNYQGVNSRLDELQAAILRVKLRHLNADNHRRQQIASYYASQLSEVNSFHQPSAIMDGSHVYHIFPFLTGRRSQLQQFLDRTNIQTLCHYPVACHKQKAYSSENHLTIPNAEFWCQHELSLPISPVLSDEQAEYVVASIRMFYQQ